MSTTVPAAGPLDVIVGNLYEHKKHLLRQARAVDRLIANIAPGESWRDVHSVDLEIEEYLEGELTVLQSQVITIPSKDQLTIHLPWTPTSAGKRTIAIRAKYVPYAGADEIIVQDQIEVEPHKQQQSVIDLNMSISQMAGLGIIGAILILFLSIWVVLFVNTARENS